MTTVSWPSATRRCNQAVFAPDRFEPTPKRQVGKEDIVLGDELRPHGGCRRSVARPRRQARRCGSAVATALRAPPDAPGSVD